MKKIATITLLGGAIVSAGMALAPMAAAAPGVSVAHDGREIGIGDHGAKDTNGDGATATAFGKRNVAVAVSVGGPAQAYVNGGKYNSALAVGVIGPAGAAASEGDRNSAVTVLRGSSNAGLGNDNHAFSADGVAMADVGNNNNVVDVLGVSQSNGSGNFSVALCGGNGQVNLSGQGFVTSSNLPASLGGVC